MLNRKKLPPFLTLTNITFSVDDILSECRAQGLLDWENFQDLEVETSQVPEIVKLNRQFASTYFHVSDQSTSQQKYRQLYLTHFKKDVQQTESPDPREVRASQRLRRLTSGKEGYNPFVDELNYGERSWRVRGAIEKALDQIPDRLTRVRFALMAPRFSIKPHVDHDPSYIVRFHLPLITNPGCLMFVKKDGETYSRHLPADGRLHFINAGLLHWVENNSDEWRLHLVIDVHGQNLLTSALENSHHQNQGLPISP